MDTGKDGSPDPTRKMAQSKQSASGSVKLFVWGVNAVTYVVPKTPDVLFWHDHIHVQVHTHNLTWKHLPTHAHTSTQRRRKQCRNALFILKLYPSKLEYIQIIPVKFLVFLHEFNHKGNNLSDKLKKKFKKH